MTVSFLLFIYILYNIYILYIFYIYFKIVLKDPKNHKDSINNAFIRRKFLLTLIKETKKIRYKKFL